MATPTKIVAENRPGRTAVGWTLERECRVDLLAAIAPRYATVVADHVTLTARIAADTPLPGVVAGQVIGRADDDNGVEALVVKIDGETERPGGGTYHITWSLSPGRKPVESNDVIARLGWEAFGQAIPLALTPARF